VTERREPYNYEIPQLRSLFRRFICLVCGRVWEHYPVDEACEEFVRVSHVDNILEWVDPGVRVRRFRSRGSSAKDWLEVTINGTHEPEKPSRESSPSPDTPISSSEPLDLRELIESDWPADGPKLIWREDDEEDETVAYILPGRGRPTGEVS
jgi:hypothetical protein